jgi:hypothetical protein
MSKKRTTKRAGATIRKSRKVGGSPDYKAVVEGLVTWLNANGWFDERSGKIFVIGTELVDELDRLTAAQRQKGGE